MILAGLGINGNENKILAIKLLREYNKFTKETNKITFQYDLDKTINEILNKNYTKDQLLDEIDSIKLLYTKIEDVKNIQKGT